MYSTTILEAAATGAVPLILNVNGFDHYSPNIAAEGGAVEVQDFAAARTALSRLMLDEKYWFSFDAGLDRVRQRFFARDRDAALAAIVSEIETLRRRRKN
jgi:glycosyltransferase involved in cell wall biosynthesis